MPHSHVLDTCKVAIWAFLNFFWVRDYKIAESIHWNNFLRINLFIQSQLAVFSFGQSHVSCQIERCSLSAAATPFTTSSEPGHPQIIFNQTLQSGVRSFIKLQSSSPSASRLPEETATTLSAPLSFLRTAFYSTFNFKNMCFTFNIILFKYRITFAELKWQALYLNNKTNS